MTFGIPKIESPVSRYNLLRVIRLATAVLILGGAGTALFGNFYTGLVSLGVVSIIVGLAVQTPMTSFIGWIYILVRAPYRVGDRIKIGEATGDVIDVSYLDTTLWEFGGQYLSTDHPSGRIIKFPNSKVLTSMVYNYSWPLFPYIWNEIKINVAYESDLEFVARTMKEVVEERSARRWRSGSRSTASCSPKTPVDELDGQREPDVVFRVEREHVDRGDRALPRPAPPRRARQDRADPADPRAPQRRRPKGPLPQEQHALTAAGGGPRGISVPAGC